MPPDSHMSMIWKVPSAMPVESRRVDQTVDHRSNAT